MKPYSVFLAVLGHGCANIEPCKQLTELEPSEAKTKLTSRTGALLSDFVYLAPETIAKGGD